MQSWAAEVVDALAADKRAGVPFELAWKRAIELHPPRPSDLGPREPSLLDEELCPVEFLRVECSDAWHGRRPKVQHLRELLHLLSHDHSSGARAREHTIRAGQLVA